ncbi:MAG: hypothetical protein ACLGIF_04215 [Actinomycetes bacterium]
MDVQQLLTVLGALAGIVVVGLLAIVPTVIEIPHGHDPRQPSRIRHRRRHPVAR